MFTLRATLAVSAAALLLSVGAPAALAQPADRPAAFTQAISAATAVSSGWNFHEAKLENDNGTWIIEVEFFSLNGSMELEYEINATTFAILKSETKNTSSAQQAEFAAIIALLGASPVTPAQAIAAAAPRTPAGAAMDRVEREIEHSALAYKFDFSNGQRVLISAVTGAPASGDNGGGGPAPTDPQVQAIIAAALAVYPNAKVLEVEFESSDNRWEVKLVTAAGVVRKLRISVAGAILSDDVAHLSKEDKARDRLRRTSSASAMITLAQAAQIANAGSPDATVKSTEWEFEHGVLVAKVVLVDAAGEQTILVNSKTGAIVTPTPAPTPIPDPAPVISPANAVAVALAANQGTAAIGVEMEPEGGRQFFKVRTLTNAMPLRLRESVIDGKTGVLWSTTLMPMSTEFLVRVRSIQTLLPSTSVTFAAAQQAALTALGDGIVQSIELERESSKLVYKVDVLVGTKMFRLVVDGVTGAVKPE